MMFRRKEKGYSREAHLAAAGKARARGKKRKAIAEYMRILEFDPDDYFVHGKVAALLAETKRFDEAVASFRASAEGYLKQGFYEKAIGVYTQASRLMPKDITIWEAIVKLQMEKNLRADAVNTLFKAHQHFRGKAVRDKGIRLLRKAFMIAPWHFEVTYELARLLAKTGEKDEAMRLFDGLADRSRGLHLRRIRSAMLRLSPTPTYAWRWLRTAFSGA